MSKSTLRPPMRRDKDVKGYRYSYGYGYGYHGYTREKRPRRINVRVLIVSVITLLIGVPGVYYWHHLRTKQLSESLWEYGTTRAAEKDWGQASAAFYRVWQIRQDPKLLGTAVKAYDQYASSTDPRGVIAAYQRAIGGQPEDTELRTRLSELLLEQKDYKTALVHANEVLEAKPGDTLAQKCRAMCLLGLFRMNQPVQGAHVLNELQQAFSNQPEDQDLALALVNHIREDLRAPADSALAQQADHVLDRLVAANPHNVRSRLLRYQYRLQLGIPSAREDINQAVLLAPNNPLVVEAAAFGALRDAVERWSKSDYLAARELFKSLISLRPKDEKGIPRPWRHGITGCWRCQPSY